MRAKYLRYLDTLKRGGASINLVHGPFSKDTFGVRQKIPLEKNHGFKPSEITPLIAELKLQYRERSMIPNFGDSYWRFLFIVKACNAYGDKDMVQKLGNQMFRPDALTAENIAWAAELGDQLNENVEQPDIVLQTPNQATADQYLRLQNLMDNEEYQREDYSDACRRIGITSGTNSRLPSMSRGVEVYMWQVIAMDQLT